MLFAQKTANFRISLEQMQNYSIIFLSSIRRKRPRKYFLKSRLRKNEIETGFNTIGAKLKSQWNFKVEQA